MNEILYEKVSVFPMHEQFRTTAKPSYIIRVDEDEKKLIHEINTIDKNNSRIMCIDLERERERE